MLLSVFPGRFMKRMRRSARKASPVRVTEPSLFSPNRLWIEVAALGSLILVIYWNCLKGGFHFDDTGIFLDPHILARNFGWGLLRWSQTRPLTFLSFHWNYLAGGNDPWGFQLADILLHALNSILVMLIARRCMPPLYAFAAGALFGVHTIQTQAVAYVFERATLLAAVFAFASLLCYFKERRVASVVFFVLSLLAKEETVALPGFLLLYDLMARRPIRWRYYAAMLAAGLIAAVRLFLVLREIPNAGLAFGTGRISAFSYALTQPRVIWTYLRMVVFPSGLSLDHDIALSQGLFSPAITAVALLALVAAIGGLFWLALRQRRPAIWALGFFILLAPSSSFIPVVDLMFEHRTYFPMACLAIAAAGLLQLLSRRRAAVVAAIVLTALALGTLARVRVWRDEKVLWTDVIEKSPRKARGYFHLAQAYAPDDFETAKTFYQKGLLIDPRNPVGHTNLGVLLINANQPDLALSHLQEALELGGDAALIWNNIGAARLHRGEAEDAVTAFRQSLSANPCRFDARYNLVHTLAELGSAVEARSAAETPDRCEFAPEQSARLSEEVRLLRY